MFERPTFVRAQHLAASVSLLNEGWQMQLLQDNPPLAFCAAEAQDVQPGPQAPVNPRTRIQNQVQAAIKHVLAHPNTAPDALQFPAGVPPLTRAQILRIREHPEQIADLRLEIVNFRMHVREFQLDLIPLSNRLDNAAIVAILPEAAWQAREAQLRTGIQTRIDGAIVAVRAALRANPNVLNSAIDFPANLRDENGLPPLSSGEITDLRDLIVNNQGTNTFRDEIVNSRLQPRLVGERHGLLHELLAREAETGVFGRISWATYNRVVAMLTRDVYSTLFNLDDRGIAFPPGCPVRPPHGDLNNRAVSDQLFRSLIRRFHNGDLTTGLNWELPALAKGAELTADHMVQFGNVLRWLRDAEQAAAPFDIELRRRALERQIAELNQPGWARGLYPNAEQWEARSRTLVGLALQIHQCQQLTHTLHNRFNNFALGDVDQPPPLPTNLNVTYDNQVLIQNALTWLHRHQGRLSDQLGRLMDAQEGNGFFMLGELGDGPDTIRINGRDIFYNRMTADFEIVEGPRDAQGRRTYLVTPIKRYHHHWLPLPRYLNHWGVQDGVVHVHRGTTQSLTEGELVFAARRGANGNPKVELMTVEGLRTWRDGHLYLLGLDGHVGWQRFTDGISAAVDLSMIVTGTIEVGAGYYAAANALRAGLTWRAAGRAFWRALVGTAFGGRNLVLGSTGIFESPYWGDDPLFHLNLPLIGNVGVTAENITTARHIAFLFDAARGLRAGRGIGELHGPPVPLHMARNFEEVVQASTWLKRIEAFFEARISRLGPNGRWRPGFLDNRFTGNWQGDLITPFMIFTLGRTGVSSVNALIHRLWERWTGQHPADIDPRHINISDISQDLIQLQQSPTFFNAFTDGLLARSGLSDNQIAAFRGIIADARPDPDRQPPARRRDEEQRLIVRFREGATERERIVAAALVLIEASRSTSDHSVPSGNLGNVSWYLRGYFGNQNSGVTAEDLKRYLLDRFRNSGDPAIRLLAAQMLLSTRNMSPPVFARFCVDLAKNNNAPRAVRMQAMSFVAGYLHNARVAESVLSNRPGNGVDRQLQLDAYRTDNFGVTARDLDACLTSIATDRATDTDLRAFAAASLHAVKHGDSDQVKGQLQAVMDRWNANANQPQGSFALATLNFFARELALPNLGRPQDRENQERIFMAASALTLLSDTAFQPLWQAQRAAAAANILASFANANTPAEQGMLRLVQPGLVVPTVPLTPEVVNNALISCVTIASSDSAVQALQLLIARLNPNAEQIANGIFPLTAAQINLLRSKVMTLLGGFRQPEGPLSDQETQYRAAARLLVFEMIPALFATATDVQRSNMVLELGHTLRPDGAWSINDNPEIRRAAAIAIGLLMEGRPAARSYVGNDAAVAAADALFAPLQHNLPPVPLFSLGNQYSILDDMSAIARLEAAVRYDSTAAVRLASLQTLSQLRPPILSNGRSFRIFCTELLETERDPVVLALLRRLALAEVTLDPTSPDWMDDFQRARYDLLFSLNTRGDSSLAGVPDFLFNPAHRLTFSDQRVVNFIRGNGEPRFPANDPRFEPYLTPYHSLNPFTLEPMARGNGPHALDALKALVYIITTRGRPFERRVDQGPAVRDAVGILFRLARDVDVAANPRRAEDLLWGLELCLVLDSGLPREDRLMLLDAYMRLVQRMPANAQRHHRAGVVASIVLQREAASYIWSPRAANMPALTAEELVEQRRSAELQSACMNYLRTYRTRAALPVLELITRSTTMTAPVKTAAQELLQLLRSDPNVVAPGTLGGPLPGTLNFDDAYEALRRQYLDGANGLFLQPGLWVRGPTNWFIRDPSGGPGGTPEMRALLLSFANGTWFTGSLTEFAPNAHLIWWQSDSYEPALGNRPAGVTPQAGMDALIRLAEMGDSPHQGERRTRHLRYQEQARLCLAWIVAVNGEGLLPSMRDHFVEQAAAALERISGSRLNRLADLDSVIEAALVGQPLMSRNREVRLHLIEALWNRRASAPANGTIANERVAIILAGALRSEFQTMPRPGEPGYDTSIRIQRRLLELLQTLNFRICAPVVQAISLHHPDRDMRERAHQTYIALLDNVWRVWDRVSHAQIDTTTAPAVRAADLRAAIASNGTPDDIVQAMFHAYLGRPIVPGDRRYQPFVEALSDTRPQVRLAAALVVLRTAAPTTTVATDTISSLLQPNALQLSGINQFENTAFTQNDRNVAMAVVADIALHGVHIGLRESARRILLEMLPNGSYTVHPSPGISFAIVKNGANVSVVENRNGHPVFALFSNGQIRRQGDGLNPPFIDAVVQDIGTSQALGLLSIHSISTGLSGPLSATTTIDYDPISNEHDWRRFWIVNHRATGPQRIAQLYALIDPRSTAVPALTKRLALIELVQLGVNGDAQAMRQISWMFRHLDPPLQSAALHALYMRLFTDLQGIPQGQAPSESQRQKIRQCLDLILAVCQSSPLTQASRNELRMIFHDTAGTPFADCPQIREIAQLFTNSVTGPITASNDIRLQWLNGSQPVLQFAAARDCLLADSTAVTSVQRGFAIRTLSRLAIEGSEEIRGQAKTLLFGLRGADLNSALDALAVFAFELQGRTPSDPAKVLRCWTLSEELCVSAHLDLDPSSERYIRVRLELLRAQGTASEGEIQALQVRLTDCHFQQLYDLRAPYSADAVEIYSVMQRAASERYGPDSVEAGRADLAVAKAAHYRSLTSPNANERQRSRELALECARHAYQVLILRLGPNSPEVCDALYRLGTIELSMNNFNDAVTHLNEALAIYGRSPSQIGTGNGAWIASQLGQAYLRKGDRAAAERISRELLTMVANPIESADRQRVVNALSELANAFVDISRPPQPRLAEPLLRRAFEIARAGFGEADERTLALMLRLADNLADQGRNAAAGELALAHARLAHQAALMRLGPDAPEVCVALYRLGRIEVEQNNLNDGITHLNDALAMYRRNPGPLGPGDGAIIAHQLARAYLRNGDIINAQRISHQLRKIASSNTMQGDHSFHVIAALSDMAEDFIALPNTPDHRSAEPLLRRALELSRVRFGESSVATLNLMLRLALSLAALGRNEEAVTLMDRAMRLCDQQTTMLPLHRSHLYRRYSSVLTQLGRASDASRALQRSEELVPAAAR